MGVTSPVSVGMAWGFIPRVCMHGMGLHLQTVTSGKAGELAPHCNARHWQAVLISGISIDDAIYPWWGLDALSNERRLAGRL